MSVPSIDVRREIGMFIRQQREARRASNFPGLIHRRRHVPHLTQADLAEIAGVSHALVAQVENGRYENLNPSILIRLAMALKLESHQEQYLLNYLQPPNGHVGSDEEIPDMLRGLVRSSMPNPAMIITPVFDLVHWNENAVRLLGDFDAYPVDERNIVVQMFLNPVMRERWVAWETYARNIVSAVRMHSSYATYRDRILRLVSYVSARDAQFREWWESDLPKLTPDHVKDFVHPEYGSLHIFQTVGAVLGSPNHFFLLMTPRDADTEAVFRRLADAEPGSQA